MEGLFFGDSSESFVAREHGLSRKSEKIWLSVQCVHVNLMAVAYLTGVLAFNKARDEC